MSYECTICLKTYPSYPSFWGHKRYCKNTIEKINTVQILTIKQNSNTEFPIDLDSNQYDIDFPVDLQSNQYNIESNQNENKNIVIETKYYEYQKKFFKHLELQKGNHVKLINGKYGQGNKLIYLKILEYIVNCHGISDSSANELIKCIKEVSLLNGKEIPLPAKFERIVKTLLDPIADLKASVELTEIEFPVQLMGNEARNLKPAKTIVLNILEIISSMLIDKNVIGENFAEFNFKFQYKYNENGTRIFSDPASAEWFRQAELVVTDEYGDEVCLLGVQLF
jgi:hypothetical protein